MRPTYSDTNIQHRRGDVKQIGGKIFFGGGWENWENWENWEFWEKREN